MTDLQNYKELIEEVKAFYESEALENRNLLSGNSFFDLIWCPGLENEINLWTYWQGGCRKDGKIKADILLVGQDYGCFESNSSIYKEYVKKSSPLTDEYVKEIVKSNSKTDLKLLELFNCLGEDYYANIPNPKLFFTNLCLGYRSVPKITGGDVSAQMRHDSVYLKRLIEIVNPKVIICIGKMTYISAVTGLLSRNELEGNLNHLINVSTNFYSVMDDCKNHISIKFANEKCEIFAVGHTGFMGEQNRKKYTRIKCSDIMKYDWEAIREFL